MRTPRWIGRIVQRPESPRLYHELGVHPGNDADLPIWDILFGTFRDPGERQVDCGFERALEAKFGAMLRFQDVSLVTPPETP